MARVKTTPAPPPEPNAPPAEITRPVVIFADDDASGRAIARRVVTNAGFGIVVARNGEEALQLTREYQPALVIADAFMPGIEGRDLARAIKKEWPEIKVVVISGVYRDSRYKHEALREFEVDDYLAKPVAPSQLRAVLEKYLK
jgi:YesN/AraC family two-component response regulator